MSGLRRDCGAIMASYKEFDITKKVLITGAAGFIGFHLVKLLLDKGATILGFDNLNDYYDVFVKRESFRDSEGIFKVYLCKGEPSR